VIAHRTFTDYAEYVYKQGGKMRGVLREYTLRHLEKRTDWNRKIFKKAKAHLKPGAILCLGARTGAENLGAIAAGFVGSVGIDLHPVGPSVVFGDWHEMPVADHVFPNVYSNSLDHCLYLDQLVSEVRRVLAPDGRFYVMASNRAQSLEFWMDKGKNEALYWDTSDALRDAICDLGMATVTEWRHGKWGHYIFGVRP